jgi:hypothetical protein
MALFAKSHLQFRTLAVIENCSFMHRGHRVLKPYSAEALTEADQLINHLNQ